MALKAATLPAQRMMPLKASRTPMAALVNDESLFAPAHETPPNAFALLFDRYTTRVYMRKSAFVLSGSTGTRLTSGRLRYPHNVLRCYFLS